MYVGSTTACMLGTDKFGWMTGANPEAAQQQRRRRVAQEKAQRSGRVLPVDKEASSLLLEAQETLQQGRSRQSVLRALD